MMKYECPVCGYQGLTRPPMDFSICPSCGTEFENDDFSKSHAELRRAWIASGAKWFSRARPRPDGWNASTQLIRAGFGYDVGVVRADKPTIARFLIPSLRESQIGLRLNVSLRGDF